MRLVVHQGAVPPVAHSFDREALLIGRAEDSDLVIGDPALSRHHAEIRRDGERWLLADRGSLNGTLLNGRPLLAAEPLRPGDRISLGPSTLVVFEPPPGPHETLRAGTPTVRVGTVCAPGDEGLDVPVVGEAPAFRAVLDAVARVAPTTATVLITGENGSGKEAVARLLHRSSPRAARPLVVVNCPAIPASLLEAELFGVEKGVATGVEPRAGLLEIADGGTLLLDEVADMEAAAQAKILRFLEDRTVLKVGGRSPRALDVRILAATNHDLAAEMERGAFRRDLYHRLSVVQLELPPLRERREDVPLLAAHFLESGAHRGASLHPDALACLLAYAFPGNVRELKHLVEGAVILSGGGEIRREHLPPRVRSAAGAGTAAAKAASAAGQARPGDRLFERIVHGNESFWEVVQRPYLRRDVSREDVRDLVARAHAEAGGSYRKMARLFRMEPDLKKLLNFLYCHDLQVRKA